MRKFLSGSQTVLKGTLVETVIFPQSKLYNWFDWKLNFLEPLLLCIPIPTATAYSYSALLSLNRAIDSKLGAHHFFSKRVILLENICKLCCP